MCRRIVARTGSIPSHTSCSSRFVVWSSQVYFQVSSLSLSSRQLVEIIIVDGVLSVHRRGKGDEREASVF